MRTFNITVTGTVSSEVAPTEGDVTRVIRDAVTGRYYGVTLGALSATVEETEPQVQVSMSATERDAFNAWRAAQPQA